MAPRRETVIGQSIQYSLLHAEKRPTFFGSLPAYFYVHYLTFECVSKDVFKSLRATWGIEKGIQDLEDNGGRRRADRSSDGYLKSLGGEGALVPMGDMGYSGSTFFRTKDGAYLVKSIPRHFEHSFFRDDMLLPYAEYMQANPASLLVRITDFLQCVQRSIGSLLGLAPSHHIVMENIMYGKDMDKRKNEHGQSVWESWDLKPMSYFYPERDVAGGVLSSEATKSKLADDFDEKIVLTLDRAEEFKAQLEKDTKLLADCNAVDYSLFLVRIPTKSVNPPKPTDDTSPPEEPPFVPPKPPSWRAGIPSADGQYVYRAAVLDFFWAKHAVQAKAMTGLINAYNVVDKQGPMSVTTEAPEYRQRFLHMCGEIIEVKDI